MGISPRRRLISNSSYWSVRFTAGKNSHFPDPCEIAEANAGEGLTLAPIIWRQRTNDVSDPEAHALLNIAQQSLLQRHRGYRVTRILKEMPVAGLMFSSAEASANIVNSPPGRPSVF